MAKRYPKEFHEFMREYIPGHSAAEISEEVKRRFNIELGQTAVKAYKCNHKIKSGTPKGIPKGHASDEYPQHIKDYILKYHKGVGPKGMAEKLNETFGTNYTRKQLKAYYGNHDLNSGTTGYFEKGHVPQNKGKKLEYIHPNMEATLFKAGHVPHNKLPIGSIIMKADGYMWQKLGEGARDWRQKHILVWEEAHGPVPDGHLVTFKDGDRTHYDLENLALVTMAESLELTRRGLRSKDKDLTETGILIVRLNCKVREKRKKEKQQNAE